MKDESSREEENGNGNRPASPKQDAEAPIKNSLLADNYSLKDENDSSSKNCDAEALTNNVCFADEDSLKGKNGNPISHHAD